MQRGQEQIWEQEQHFRHVLQLPAWVTWGINSGLDFLNFDLEEGKCCFFFTGLTAGTGITNRNELCREL